jgi:adenosylhomocysteinase
MQNEDDGGDATLLIHWGLQGRERPHLPGPEDRQKEVQIILNLLKETLKTEPGFWHNVVKEWSGVSEETTTACTLVPDVREG